MSKQLKKRKFFTIWQEEKEKAWLQDMSKKGWHLVKKGFATFLFERGDKIDYIYNINYLPPTTTDVDEYKAIYKDAGWEHVDDYASWQYYRIINGQKHANITYDVQSKKRRLKKLIVLLLSLVGFNLFTIFLNLFINWIGFESISAIPIVLFILWGISAVVVLLLLMSSIRLYIDLNKLNKSLEE